MQAKVINGREIADSLYQEYAERASAIGRRLSLGILQVGDREDSNTYIDLKRKACEMVGVDFHFPPGNKLPEDSNLGDVFHAIDAMNGSDIDGVIVELPLPRQLRASTKEVLCRVDPLKDVEGLHKDNLGELIYEKPASGYKDSILPCFSKAVMRILEYENIGLRGKQAVIINHTPLIGRPLYMMLLNEGVTTINCHEFTNDIQGHTEDADIVITAVGNKAFRLTAGHLKPGAVVIDGAFDADESVYQVASHVTPHRGGVGPVTVAFAVYNLGLLAGARLSK